MYAFRDCTKLKEIWIPDSVIELGYCAFASCESLEQLHIGAGVTKIGESCFISCNSLKEIVIPASVTDMGENVFHGCTALKTATVEGSPELYWGVFSDCTALEEITFRGDAPTFGDETFRNVTATAYYPAGNATWTEAVMQDYEGDITWKPYCPNAHSFGEWITEGANSHRTCIYCGYTEHKVVTDSGDVEIEIPEQPDLDVDVELPFRDVPKSAWFRESVEFVYGNGYMSGVSPTSFAPHQSVTRGMLVTVLYRIAGSPEVSSDSMNSFRDVKSSAYYAKAVAWAKENGIVAGISATMFGPDRQITRQDAVTILYRYYTSYLMLDGSFEGNLSRFADRRAVSSYAEVSVSWAASVGILSGSPSAAGQMINPKNTLTRAEISKLLYCLVELICESV
jgi:hypothetical protein